MKLKERLYSAFASRVRPSKSEITRQNVNSNEVSDLQRLLANRTAQDLTDSELKTVVESKLWALSPQAFLYFMPAFLNASLESYESLSVFASEVLDSLTQPSRSDFSSSLDQIASHSSELSLPTDLAEMIGKQQLQWFDSGLPSASFQERFADLSFAEGAAVLKYLLVFKEKYGENFPFNEIDMAIERFWCHYQ